MPRDIELEQETDARWLAAVPALPGVLAYGATPERARDVVSVLAFRVMADRIEHGEELPDAVADFFVV